MQTKNERKKTVARRVVADSCDISCTTSQLAGLPYQELPEQMVVAIDGWSQSGKYTAGELIAESIAAVLVDSGRLYRALAYAAFSAGIDCEHVETVRLFCQQAFIDVRFGLDGRTVREALFSVNGEVFTKTELKMIGIEAAKIARVPEVRHLVNDMLRECAGRGRVVMLGRDIGGTVFPETPFKFFLDAPSYIRERRHFQNTGVRGAQEIDAHEGARVKFAEDALMIDTGRVLPDEVRSIILVELFWRAIQDNAVRFTV